MKLVIDIPDELYEECKRLGDSRDTLFEAIRQSAPYEERPQGEWIVDKEHSITMDFYKCTNCNYFCGTNHHRYCPKCGSYMRVKQ